MTKDTMPNVKKTQPLFRVGRSHTGLGLFATAPIAPGTVMTEYTGVRISTAEATRREQTLGHRYMMTLDKRWSIDGSPRSNKARYVNHACKPNADAINDGGRVYLVARRRIAVGEEITYNYGRDYIALFFGGGEGCLCATCVPRENAAKAAPRTGTARPKISGKASGKTSGKASDKTSGKRLTARAGVPS